MILLYCEIPGLPPSVNTSYRFARGRMYKTNATGAWQKMATLKLRQAIVEEFKAHRSIGVNIELLRPSWRPKTKGRELGFVRKDLDNMIKSTCDAIRDAIRVDDSAFFRIVAEKLEQGEVELTRIYVEQK